MSRTLQVNKILCTEMSKGGFSDTIVVAGAEDLSVSIVFAEGTEGVKINFLHSNDGKNYHPVEAVASDDGGTFATSTTRPQLYSINVSPSTYFKLQVESISKGSICSYATGFCG